jgi:hypothetical protein
MGRSQQVGPLLVMVLLTWLIVAGQRQTRSVRRSRVASLDLKLRELHLREDELRLTIENIAAERVQAVSMRAELLSSTMASSLELQRVLDDQRVLDREMADAYGRAHNATRLKDSLVAKVDAACQKHGAPIPKDLAEARALVLAEQTTLEKLASELDAARQRAAAAAARVADDALAAEAEAAVAVTAEPLTAEPPATEPRKRRHRRNRKRRSALDNSTVSNATLGNQSLAVR